MTKNTRLAALILAALSMGLLSACGSSEEAATEGAATESAAEETTAQADQAPAEEARIPELSVEEVARRLDAGEAVAVDANNAGTRERMGTVPGARLLTSSGRYQTSELPEDHDTCLIFYCANNHCNASDGAAGRAREQGYSNVNVMRAGIAGWVEAGKEVEHPST